MATTRNQISYGSQGSDVTELQKLLNQNGYTLDEDGIFGTKTQDAVKDYQQKNNLDVDGIVGTNTWGALTNASSGAATTPTNTAFKYDAYQEKPSFKYDAYQPSDAVTQAQTLLQQQLANKPGQYTSPWQTQLNDAINKIMNREKFSYDMNADALYQQYKDQYVTQGQMAMMDTMGQAAAMTGGYGNSYAQAVGQQAYQSSLQQLNDKIPELYQLALSKYQMEGDDLYNQYSLLSAQDQQEYGRHRDTVSDWQVETDRLQNQYNTERDYDYSKWADNRDFSYGQYVDDRNFDYSKWADGRDFGYGQYIDDRNYDYQVGRDQVADSQWQAEFDEAVRQFNFANKLGEFAPVVSAGGGGDGGGSNYNPTPSAKPTGGTGGDNTSFTQKLANLETVGATSAERAQLVDEMVKDGTIAPSQAAGLKHIWAKG